MSEDFRAVRRLSSGSLNLSSTRPSRARPQKSFRDLRGDVRARRTPLRVTFARETPSRTRRGDALARAHFARTRGRPSNSLSAVTAELARDVLLAVHPRQARAAGDDLDRGTLGQKAAQEPDRGDGYRLVSEYVITWAHFKWRARFVLDARARFWAREIRR